MYIYTAHALFVPARCAFVGVCICICRAKDFSRSIFTRRGSRYRFAEVHVHAECFSYVARAMTRVSPGRVLMRGVR